MKLPLSAWLVFAALLPPAAGAPSTAWTIPEIRIEGTKSPLLVDRDKPRVSWLLDSAERNARQSAYRLELFGTDGKTLWDSGRVDSAQSANLVLEPQTLASNTDYTVRVTSWNQAGIATTAKTSFSTGLLNPGDWKAKWIGFLDGQPADPNTMTKAEIEKFPDPTIAGRSQLLRTEFPVKSPLRRARIFSTGVGFYELSINGKKIGDHVMAPARTRYSDRVLYEGFDVLGSLKIGTNAIGVQLGEGWFGPTTKEYWDWRMSWSGYPRAIVQLELEYEDGSRETVATDAKWKAALGAITTNSIYDGEAYDARLEQPGWDAPGFDDSKWQPAVLTANPTAKLAAHLAPPERVVATVKPVAEHTPSPGVQVYDLGQNISGWCRIHVTGKSGSVVTLRHAEDINPDFSLNPKTNRKAKATDTYILKGTGDEIFEPRFTYHGFQYVSVTVTGDARVTALEGRVVSTDSPKTGTLQTDNALINRIHDATVWSQIGDTHGLPVDCPQRDERLGWLADGYVTADEMLCNFDGAALLEKWADDIRLTQSPEGQLPHVSPRAGIGGDPVWSCGHAVVTWEVYRHTGDKTFLSEQYPALTRYADFLTSQAKNFILPKSRYGDWGSPAQSLGAKVSGWKRGTPELATTAVYYFVAAIAADAAKEIGNDADHRKYSALQEKIAAAFREKYYDASTRTFRGETYHFQFNNGLPLFLGMVDQSDAPGVQASLLDNILKTENGHLVAGIVGARYVTEYLSRIGRDDVVYGFVTAKGFPGYEDMLTGRNTLPEFWNGSGSHNHVMFGSIDGWFYRALAGIRLSDDHPGYTEFIIKPYFPARGLNAVSASVQTIKGRIASAWKRTGNRVTLDVEIPANTEARVILPVADANQILRDGKPLAGATDGHIEKSSRAETSLVTGSGRYQFAFPLNAQ